MNTTHDDDPADYELGYTIVTTISSPVEHMAHTAQALIASPNGKYTPQEVYTDVITQEMQAIFDLDIHATSVDDPRHIALRTSQAEQLDGLLGVYAKESMRSLLRIGWLLTHGKDLALHTYVGEDSMDSWAEHKGILAPIRKLAVDLASIVPYYESIGLTTEDLLATPIDNATIKVVLGMKRDRTRQYTTLLEKAAQRVKPLPEERSDEDLLEEETEEAFAYPPEVIAQANKAYQAEAQVQMRLLQTPGYAQYLLEEKAQKLGTQVLPKFILSKPVYDPHTNRVTFTCNLDIDERLFLPLDMGKHELFLYYEGETISLKDLSKLLYQLIEEADAGNTSYLPY